MYKVRNSQTGAVLVISLIMLVLMTIVVVLSMRGSHIQEKIAGNEKFHVEAMLAAEACIAEAIACVRNAQNPATGKVAPDCDKKFDNGTKKIIVPLDSTGTKSKGGYWAEICGTAAPNDIDNIPVCTGDDLVQVTPKDGGRPRALIKCRGYSLSDPSNPPSP